MKLGKTFLCVFLMSLYLFFPGNGLAFVNHMFHDRGLPEIECTCDSETERHAGHPLSDHNDQSSIPDTDCPCANHLPIHRPTLVHSVIFSRLSFLEKVNFVPELYYPIIVPPQNHTV